MFIEFKANNKYISNSFNKEGDVTENIESGSYYYNYRNREIITRLYGGKNKATLFKIISLDKTELVIQYANSPDAAILTCRKVVNKKF